MTEMQHKNQAHTFFSSVVHEFHQTHHVKAVTIKGASLVVRGGKFSLLFYSLFLVTLFLLPMYHMFLSV